MNRPEDSIPSYQDLMLPVLRHAVNGEVKISDVVRRISDDLNLSDDARSVLIASGGQTLISNRTHWAKTYLVKAGLLASTRRGHFRITPDGTRVLSENPARVDNKMLAQFQSFRNFTNPKMDYATEMSGRVDATSDQQLSPYDVMASAHAELETSLGEELLERVRTAPPDFFERLIVNLLLAMGYGGSISEAGRAIGKTGDNGVDGVVDQDPLGLDQVYIQAKRYGAGNTVGPGEIRDFFGSLDRHKASKGLFVTTSTFTASAKETADYLSKRIVLIDGLRLTKLMVRHNIGCRIKATLHVKDLDEDFFE